MILHPIVNNILRVFFLEWFENKNFSKNVRKKLNKLLSEVKSPYISDMKFTVFTLGPYSPSFQNIQI